MADKDLGLSIQYPPPPAGQRLDDAYAAGKQARDWQQLRVDPAFAPAPAPGAGEQAGGGEAQASAASAAVTAFEEYRKQSVSDLLEGLGKALVPLPGEQKEGQNRLDVTMQGLKQAVIDGVMGLASAPFMAAGAAAGQGLENLSPEQAKKEILDADAAFTVRHLLSGAPDLKTLSKEQVAAMRQPMTMREAVETGVALGLPFIKGPVKGGARKLAASAVQAHTEAIEAMRGTVRRAGAPGIVEQGPGGQSAFRGQPRPAQPAAEGPVPKPAAGAEAKINTARIDTTETVKQTISDLSKFAGERLEEHRKRQSHDKVVAEAAGTRWSLEQMLSHEPESILVDEAKAFKLRNAAAAAAEFYDSLGKRAEAGDPAAIAQLPEAFAVAVKLSALDEAQARNLARGLEMRKEVAAAARVARTITPANILEISRKLGEEEPDPLITFRRVQALRPEQRQSFFWQLYNGLRAGRDILHSAWINALLSNPKTHEANLLATGLVMAVDIPETYLAGWVNKILFRNPEGVQRAEAGIKIKSLAEGMQDGWRLMGETLRSREEPFGRGKTKEWPKTSAETYGFSPDNVVGQTIDAMGVMIGSRAAPTRLLMTEDAFMKGVAYRMELNALAMREALAEGKEGTALAARAKELMETPSGDMITKAQDQAVLLTLNKELGMAGRSFMAAANAVPGGRILFPFVQTPGNGLKWSGQRLPILSLLSTQNWSDVMGNAGPAARDKAIARTLIGNAAAMAIAWEVMNGHLTGPGPKDKNLAALQRDPATSTKPPFSACPPWTNECYGYSRLDPVGAYVGAVAAWVEMYNDIPDQDTLDEWTAYGQALVIAGGELGASKNWAIGFSNVIDALKSPDTSGGKLIASFARSIVPAGVREMARQMDDNIVREVQTIPDALRSGIPGLTGAVAEKLNPITGNPTRFAPGWGYDILPIPVTTISHDPVFQVIQRNHISIGPVPKSIGPKPNEGAQLTAAKPDAGIALTGWERWQWTKIYTQEVKIGGRDLHGALTNLVTSDRFQQWSPDRQTIEFKGLVLTFREIGKDRLIAEHRTLREALHEREQRKIEALKNPAQPGANPLDALKTLMGR